jgi:hypothetical protein
VPRTSSALDDPEIAHAVETLWNYHRLDTGTDTRTDVGIGLGSHDLSVATTTAELYHRGLFAPAGRGCGLRPVLARRGLGAASTARQAAVTE